MVCPPVQAVSGEEIGRLVTRLERYGLQTAQVRCFLLLLQQGVNDSEYWVFASDEDTAEAPVTLVITLPLPGLLVMDAFCADSPAGHDRLLAALLCDPVSRLLWRPDRRLRADSWPVRLRPALERAAGRRGYTVTPVSAGACLFVREADGAPDTEVARIRWEDRGRRRTQSRGVAETQL
ncbi:hypothetical protein FJT64_018867 [Amphibalanus amphitrite]|uniref:Uncharacterized protein n=1 Tax=Amphibalanus amphitrite TaxID=1232801 RepID=A0A6A4WTD3_AMPAM|nr:hypothetical protein FJT64_018867 [Amphibalanus amphitrite]